MTTVGVALLFSALAFQPAAADRGALMAACFPPASLAGREGELKPVRTSARPPAIPQSTAQPPPLPANLRGQAIRRVDVRGGAKLIALTFDLCETNGEIAGYDAAVVQYLRQNGIKATFFAGGKWMADHDTRTQQLLTDPLFEIGNHGWAHRNARLLSGRDLQQEIEGPQGAYQAARGRLAVAQCAAPHAEALRSIAPRIAHFRFPFGACNPASLAAVADAGLTAVQWDISTGDPDPHQPATAIAAAMLRAKSGSIVLMHANGRGYNTAAALPLALPKLKAQGYTFVTVSELLAAGTPVLAPTCYDARPGDTDKYDCLFPVSRPQGLRADAAKPAVPR